MYLVGYGAFHIRTKEGTNYNFAALNQQVQPQPPDAILTAIDNAMGSRPALDTLHAYPLETR